MYNLPEWPIHTPPWTGESLQLLDEPKQTPVDVTLEDILTKSDNFPVKFPIDSVRCKILKNTVIHTVLENYINSAYPLLHENALYLYAQFLLFKKQHGTSYEKNYYKNMTILDFIERLLTKRAVMFMGKFDSYIILDGTRGAGKWNLIGKDPKSKLLLENCLSYDEIKLSVFLSVSSFSYFINNGTRKNYGKASTNRNDVQDEGVIIGLIGARLKKIGAMEYEEMVITNAQNTADNGYGSDKKSLHSVFANFYEEPCFTYKYMLDHKKNEMDRFTSLGNDAYFDNVLFSKRMALSIDTLLIEANERAKMKSTTAFIHVVGIGLGVWRCSAHQEDVFVQTFANRLQALGKTIRSISDVYFSYFNATKCGEYTSGSVMKIEDHPKGIKIHIGKRDPHMKLAGGDKGKLLIVSYAWDGNALPGNEFWDGKLASTGDSAAAASTQITEIHNPHINPKVCAANLQVATANGLVSFAKYREKVKGSKRKLEGGDEDDQ